MCDSLSSEKPKRRRSNTSTWKQAERELAKLLGGERIPVTGRASGERADIKHPFMALEAKHGKQIPSLLRKAFSQAKKAAAFYLAQGEGEHIPTVIFHPDGGRYDESFVIVQIKDLQRLATLLERSRVQQPAAADPGDLREPA